MDTAELEPEPCFDATGAVAIPAPPATPAALEAAGVREAAVLETGGAREAAVLQAAGRRNAAVLATAGQRDINLIWENTQMKVALSVIWAALLVAGGLSVFGRWLGSPDLQLAAVVFLFGVANLVTGFYFGRTNHTRSAGMTEEGGR